jgi:hypothetical protein
MVYDTVNKKNRWRRGTVLKRLSDRSYSLSVNGREWRRNRQHLKKVDSSAQDLPFYIADDYDDFAAPEAAPPDEDPIINEDNLEDPLIDIHEDVNEDVLPNVQDDVDADPPIDDEDDEAVEEPYEAVAHPTTTRSGRRTQVPRHLGNFTT